MLPMPTNRFRLARPERYFRGYVGPAESGGMRGTASVCILSTPDQIFHCRKEHLLSRGFVDVRRALAGAVHSFPPAIDQEGYAPLPNAAADLNGRPCSVSKNVKASVRGNRIECGLQLGQCADRQ